MTTDDFLSGLWEFLTQWGPVALAVGAAIFLMVTAAVVALFVFVLRFIAGTHRSIRDTERRMDRARQGRRR